MTQAITLHAGLSNMPPGISRVREMLKLQLRARLQQRQTRIWLQLLNSHPVFGELLQTYPRLMHKVYRHYLSKNLSCRQRVALLVDHYHFILQQGWGKLMAQAARAPVRLGTVQGKSGAPYHLQLCALQPMDREGEMVLQLAHGDDVIYSVAFTFFGSRASMAVGIGCLQGPRGAEGLHRVREATRDLHGMRPKALMVRLVRQLGHEHGCRNMILVGNNNRAVHHSAKKGRLFADYNALWQELGAQARGDGDFELPCENLPMPVMEDLPSKKRSEARKRHALTLAMIASLRSGLDTHRCPAQAAMARLPATANDARQLADFDDDYVSSIT
ncbi:VirK/YbjX family protein [Janthinobacterium sp. SUN118]|uniref:VirK/YbjX family protein n=1 Tax=Janthinobacterium sp. SUN118 TaxID=3004100 RepID=UPI0025B128C7|nr:VirK/YbjX family protein [Janthinobacterium sp. SUN118]MDN2708459.1 VirK/YbjX family protein [Janthinobacterium sp. SUN118]